MDTTNQSGLTTSKQLELLSTLFGSYKAEWLEDSLFELFSEPSYFPELTTTRPCVLIGGRGTGKTTVLKSLSYAGQFELKKRRLGGEPSTDKNAQIIKEMPYFGFYYRANTPRISAFCGDGLSLEEWKSLFQHYLNVLFGIQLIKFLQWYETNAAIQLDLMPETIETICGIYAIEKQETLANLLKSLNRALIEIESYINNISSATRPKFSSGGTLDHLFTLVSEINEFRNKTFFLILDEYENFRDEQQQVINTLIKHTSTSYTFKIGVKKLGWRVRHTNNENENLISPADYVLIDISEKLTEAEFRRFAEDVCNSRIQKLLEASGNKTVSNVRELLPELNTEQEASLLGLSEVSAVLRHEVNQSKSRELIEFTNSLRDMDLYVIKYLADGAGKAFLVALYECMTNFGDWAYRLDEYKFASLFSLRTNLRGIRKYYAGWNVFSMLSGINIRYLLELIEQTLILHIKKGGDFASAIPPETQTFAAQAVGQRNLQELDGLSIFGARLKKLVLGLGRIFGSLAEASNGHAHEVNQFRIRNSAFTSNEGSEENIWKGETKASQLVNAAVMHLALIPFPGNKPKQEGDTKEFTYQLHPIFAPYFIFSYRKRRDIVLDEDQIIGLVNAPQPTIRGILKENNREISGDIPEQLKLFVSYYDHVE